jgi:pimeloyl-ACP methyl ester carboxylesterase
LGEYAVVEEGFTLDAGHLATGEQLFIRGDVRVVADGHAAKPVLVICHGFKSFKDWGFFPYIAGQFAKQGFYVVAFNFSCNGVNRSDFDELERFAVNTFTREQQDVGLIMKALTDRTLPLMNHADAESIHLLGHSKGGGTSILFAADHPSIKSVVTWNGIGYTDLFDDQFKQQLAENGIAYVTNARTKQEMPIKPIFYEDLLQNKDRYHIVQRLAEMNTPVLHVQGDKDGQRLLKGLETMRAAAPNNPVTMIEGGTHTFGAVHPFKGTTPQLEQALQASVQFLKDCEGDVTNHAT